MRRSSVVGPLLLIVIGVVFLISNLRPDLSLWTIVVEKWPYLLIAWGVARLLEIFAWALRGKPLPEKGIGGGEWTLIVFLCLVGSGVFFFHRNIGYFSPDRIRIRGMEVFGEAYDYTIAEQKIAAGKAPRVLIENFYGNARIIGADVEEVKVSGRKTVRSFVQEEADKADAATPLEVNASGEQVTVRTNHQRVSGERRVNADLEIAVPRSARVECRGRMGDFDITDLTGDVDISSHNAGVRVQNIGGGLKVDLMKSDLIRAASVKGEVELKGRGSNVELENIEGQVIITGAYFGDLQFRNLAKPLRYDGPQTTLSVQRIAGEIRLGRGYLDAHNLVGPIQLNSRSKDVQIRSFTEALNLTLDRGDVELHPAAPLAKMDVRTRSGRIELALPAASKFDLHAEVHRGEANNDYGEPLRLEHEGRGARLVGRSGDGPSLVLVTDRGDLTVRKGGEMSLPAPPRPPKPELPATPNEPRRIIFDRN